MAASSQQGLFITFEGSEGCGKTTQIRLLLEELEKQGLRPVLVREPGGTAIGEHIRHLLQHAPEGSAMHPETELLLFAASRAQLVRETILPALAQDRVVISDRFLDSTTVYQGVARQVPQDRVAAINDFAAGPRLPDITFLLDMDAPTAMARLRAGRGPEAPRDRMEEQPEAFYQAVRDGYLALAAAFPRRIRTLDATLPPQTLASEILTHLASLHHALLEAIRT